jgi:outer membrane receptor protein involved in Fe transport
VNHKPWHLTGYVTNLLDKQEVLVPPSQISPSNNFDKLADDYVINPPRTVGIRVGYTF